MFVARVFRSILNISPLSRTAMDVIRLDRSACLSGSSLVRFARRSLFALRWPFCMVISFNNIQIAVSAWGLGGLEFQYKEYITKTRLYNFDPLKPHFYIVKLGFTGVYINFLIFAQKHILWVLVRTASSRRF